MYFVSRIDFDLQEGKILLGAHEVSSFIQSLLSRYLVIIYEKESESECKLPVLVLRIVHCYFYVSAV